MDFKIKMKNKIYILLLFIFNISIINGYQFDIDIKSNKITSCILNYDESINKNLSFKANKLRSYNYNFDSNVNLNCNVTLNYVKYNIINDDNNIIYTETIKNQKSFDFDLNISKIELNLFNENTCTIRTDKYKEEITFEEDSSVEYEFLNIFSLSCDKNLTQSTLRLYDESNYNKYYRLFTEKYKSFTLDLDKEVINYNNEIEVIFQLYDRTDKFSCKIDSYGKTLTFKDTKNSIIAITEVYVDSEFNMDCNYNFKKIDLYVSDHYIGKQFKEFSYSNVSDIIVPIDSFDIEAYNKVNRKPEPKPVIKKAIVEEIRFSVKEIEPFIYTFDYSQYNNVSIDSHMKFWEKLLVIFK